MLELFNFRWDRRTAYNVLKLPFIICVRVPVVLILLLAQYIEDHSDILQDYLPGWDK